ncbi:D-3-phosphoglycerate dehydrogenase [Bacillus sp. FJAT-27916]|uniref:phosphoglycerate dehydrogenase n=1 Tax=Bacillaceae TaxID=186817 RepID=UPI000670E059|nr:phosphoglycerate dehydrogenase [Bacillus sp. FJAT-27916]KMY44138.1 D-3-phosphoglycerate dehydrogenase [Bacillus sp. FJAT-27916]
MFKVLVADAIKPDGLTPFIGREDIEVVQKTVENAKNELHEFDALLVRSATKVTEALLNDMTSLKIIARAGVGVDNIDVPSCTKRGVIVVNAPDGNTISTAEHTFAMIASLARNIPQAHQTVKNSSWERNRFAGTELKGKTLGIVGMGRIGSELTKRARAFQMDVFAFDPFLTTERAKELHVTTGSFEELLTVSDFITVHTPLTKDTKGLLNRETIQKCKDGVYLINCARGGIIDEEALYDAVESGKVAGAALDVFVEEPPVGNRLLNLDQIIVTPHLGASTKEAQLNVAKQVAKEVVSFVDGIPVSNSINLPAIPAELFSRIQPYYQLVRTLGSFLSQFINEGIKEISITYGGDSFDYDTSILTKALVSGFFKGRVDVNVNEVNALLYAKERSITVGEKISNEAHGYSSSVTVKVVGETKKMEVKATYIKEYGPRIFAINDFKIDFYPEGHILYIQHHDRPGVIGVVGKKLGDLNLNIATMQVGRKEAGGEAIMVLTFDDPLPSDIPNELLSTLEISEATLIELPLC